MFSAITPRRAAFMRAVAAAAALLAVATPAHAQRFEISYTTSAHAGPITGRLILFLARSAQPEPRLLLSPRGPAIFGVDLDQLRPGQAAIVDNGAIGYPMALSDLPPGDYVAQAVITTFSDRWDRPINEIVAQLDSVRAMPDGPAKTEAMRRLQSPIQDGMVAAAPRVYIGRDRSKAALLRLHDPMGRTRLLLSVDSLGVPKLQFFDDSGRVTATLPEGRR